MTYEEWSKKQLIGSWECGLYRDWTADRAEKDREIDRWKARAEELDERSYNDGYTAGLAAGGDFLTKVGRDDLRYRLLTECRPGG